VQNPVEQHRPRTAPEARREHLPLSVKISSGTPCARIVAASVSHTGRTVARSTSRADT
jgi:hypothetical protein